MKFPCNYHPQQNAHWHCESCGRFFCNGCVPCGHEIFLRAGGAKCALCFKRLDYLGAAVDAPTPTREILNCLKYPLQTNVLFLLVPMALLMAVFSLATGGALVGFTIVPLLVASTISVEYASSVFLARSQGQNQAPTLGSIGQRPDILFFIRHGLLLLIGISISLAVDHWLAAALYFLYLPAGVVVLVNERSITSALNPALIIRMIRALGRDYWIACGFCLAMALASTFAIISLPLVWPFFLLYSLYACYAYLGYLYFYHQYELRARVPQREETFVSKQEFEKRRALSDSFILFKENQLDRAREILKQGFKNCEDDLDLHLQYQQVLLAASDELALRNHTDFLLDRLSDNDLKQATRIFSQTRERQPDYRPREAAANIALAQQLRLQNKPQPALSLLKEFHQRYADSALIPKAYLLAAEIFHEHLADNGKAMALLNYLLEKNIDGIEQTQIQALRNKLLSQ